MSRRATYATPDSAKPPAAIKARVTTTGRTSANSQDACDPKSGNSLPCCAGTQIGRVRDHQEPRGYTHHDDHPLMTQCRTVTHGRGGGATTHTSSP